MKPSRIYLILILGLGCLVLSVATAVLKKSNETLRAKAQQRAAHIANVQRLNRDPALTGLVQAMANLSVNDANIKRVLETHGFTIKPPEPQPAPEAPAPQPTPTPAPQPAPAPAPAPQSTPEPELNNLFQP